MTDFLVINEGMEKMTVTALATQIPTEADAYILVESLRWNGRVVCPHCGLIDGSWYIRPLNGVSRRTRTGSPSQRRVWKCSGCRKQFSATTGTVMHGSKVPLRIWLFVIFEMCANKTGSPLARSCASTASPHARHGS